MKPPMLLSEIESAIYLKMTPELLRYFTSRAVKSGEGRKLVFVERDGVRWYDKGELDSFNSYLLAPWPKKHGAQRPHLPSKIKEEIMLEAAAACPVCGHEASGEAAHIEPVAKTMSHHPGGLIWLCPTHHTVVDKVAVAHNVKMETIRVLKEVLVNRRLRVLNLERAASGCFLQLIRQCETLSAMIDNAAFGEAKQGLEAMVSVDLKALEESAEKLISEKSNNKKGKKPAPLQVLAFSVSKSAKKVNRAKHGALAEFAATAASARARYLEETGQVDCPVCNGNGTHRGRDCPACGGEGAVDKDRARQIDVSDYEDVKCPLCEGTGRRNGDDCPECSGEGKFERRYLEAVDLRLYDDVKCPVCKGKGIRAGENCAACGGEGEMERRYADRIDPGDYSNINCKLCRGSGQVDHENCPACGGEGEMERRHYDNMDWREWEVVDCPKCKGNGHVKHDDCRSCGGAGMMYRRQTYYLD
ncbi:HNH nuclease [Rhabdaerophilaceae bacterium]